MVMFVVKKRSLCQTVIDADKVTRVRGRTLFPNGIEQDESDSPSVLSGR